MDWRLVFYVLVAAVNIIVLLSVKFNDLLHLGRSVKEIKDNIKEIDDKVDKLAERVSKLEGKVE